MRGPRCASVPVGREGSSVPEVPFGARKIMLIALDARPSGRRSARAFGVISSGCLGRSVASFGHVEVPAGDF